MTEFDFADQHILLVDDVFFARETVKKILFGFGNPHLTEAQNGYTALAEVRDRADQITLVIADFKMPKMNGMQLVKLIRSGRTALRRSLPIAMLTGYGESELVELALRLDINAFLIKPVSSQTLGTRLKKVIDQGADTSWLKNEAVYAQIDVGGAEIELPPPPERDPNDVPSLAPQKLKPARRRRRPNQLQGKFEDHELSAWPGGVPEFVEGRPKLRGKFTKADIAGDHGDPGHLTAAQILQELAAKEHAGKKDGAKEQETKEYIISRLSAVDDDAPAAKGTTSAKQIAAAVQALVEDCGTDIAMRVVTSLDEMVRKHTITSADVARVLTAAPKPPKRASTPLDVDPTSDFFAPLDNVQPGTTLARAVHAIDGNLMLSEGAPLTPRLVAIITALAASDLVLLDGVSENAGRTSDAGADEPPAPALGLMVRFGRAADLEGADTRQVVPEELTPGTILGGDVILTDGRQYLIAGAKLTPRIISLLQDLKDLGRLTTDVTVVV